MELRQLRYFIKAKELLNFTEAADQLFISQSTLSQQIKQLEDELGTPLFNRVGRRVHLTEAGILFYDYALQCVHKANDGYQMLKDLNNLQTGELIIGTTFGLRHILKPAVLEFSKRFPHVQIQIIFGTSIELIGCLSNFELDFVLTFEDNDIHDEMKYQPLFTSELGLIAAKKSPIASRNSISIKDIKSLPIALPAQGFSTRRFIDDVFKTNSISPQIKLQINDIPMLLELVETGHWYTILSKTSVSSQQNLVCVPIQSVDTLQQAGILSLKGIYQKQAVKAFLDLLLKK